MNMQPEIALHLCQVLEEEYESLHAPIGEEDFTAYLPDPGDEGWAREVTARRDWLFHKGHVKGAVGFAAALLSEAKPSEGAPALDDAARRSLTELAARNSGPNGPAKRQLKKYLLGKLSPELLWDIFNSARAGGGGGEALEGHVRKLEQKLNDAVLSDKKLYDCERFSRGWLSDDSRGLLALRDDEDSLKGEDLQRLNRLLLEDAFPAAFERVYVVRLAAIHARLHAANQAALCLSGGGIRSGTFALGLMQGLARHRLLEKFDYLSTVSGGGYIGSWLTAWIHRHPDGLAGVTYDLAVGSPADKIDPDPAPVRYLRSYSNFITPKVGLLTADTWSFIGIYLRNLFINWMVFVPLILSVLLIPRLLLALTLMQPEQKNLKALFHLPGLNFASWQFSWVEFHSRHIFLTLGVALGSWALAYIIFNRPSLRTTLEERRPFWRGKTGQEWFLLLCLLPLVLSAFCLTTYWAWAREADEGKGRNVVIFLLFGVVFTALGWIMAAVVLRRGFRKTVETVLGLLIVGLLGGALFYALAQTPLGKPVIGYNENFGWLTTDWFKWATEWYVCLAVPAFLLVFLLATTIFVALSSASHRIDDEDREWWARLMAWVLIAIIIWVSANGLVIVGPLVLLLFPKIVTTLGGISGLVTLLAGRSAKTPAGSDEEAKGGVMSSVMGSLLPLLALLFAAFLVAALSLATTGIIQALALAGGWLEDHITGFVKDELTNAHSYADYVQYIYEGITPTVVPDWAVRSQLVHLNVLHHTSFWLILSLGAVLFAVGVLLARVINLNLFSLHAGYRNRLIRAFLGASRPAQERKPNPFTGFDRADNLHMHELRSALLNEGDLVKPELIAAAVKKAFKHVDDAGKAGRAKSPDEASAKEAAGGDAQAEQSPPDALSLYLVREDAQNPRRQERLAQARWVLSEFAPDVPVSQQLLANMRADLNSILKTEKLYEQPFARETLKSARAQELGDAVRDLLRSDASEGEVRRAMLRSDYHVLLNRFVLEDAYPGALKPTDYPPPPHKLLHVVNTTLNLVGGGKLAWQQRKAEPFSISPLHAGCFRLGYRNARDYGGRDTSGISIGTAATISGAAASSNMGYYTTSPVISLLLTIFNVRLGWWLGNPGPHGRYTYHLSSPRYSAKPVISEAFGLTDDTNEYVYLTDGGHFENLAVYEMVLRRCRFIVVSDGAQDEKFRFGDLGNAVRKIRIDLGVPIEFTDVPIYAQEPPAEEGKGVYWAVGKIRYTCIDTGPGVRDGVLLYIKPAVYGNEPRDVLEYKKSFPPFPHQSTGDQFFDEPQFESYRMLGSHIMDQICGDDRDPLELRELIGRAFEGLKGARSDELDLRFRLNPLFVEWAEDWLKEMNPAAAPPPPPSSPPVAEEPRT